MAHVVTLVPWRPGERWREAHWDFVRPTLEALGFPLFTGDSFGDWARAGACNAASEKAGDWDIALVADADSVLEYDAVHEAVGHVARTRGAARPHDHRYMLSMIGTKVLTTKGLEWLLRNPKRFLSITSPGGGALVIHRQAWEIVKGYDERYIGWGYEDSAMNIALATRTRWDLLPGNSYHLWHPMANTRTATAIANRNLLEAFRAERASELRVASRRAGRDLNEIL